MEIITAGYCVTILLLWFISIKYFSLKSQQSPKETPLKVKILHHSAILPQRAEPGSVGYDLCSIDEVVLRPFERKAIDTGVAVELPPGVYGRIAPRSGNALKFGLDVMAGVVDPSYKGELKVILVSLSDNNAELRLPKGSKIAQLVLEYVATPDVVEVDQLSETERGSNGFGSTGLVGKK